MWTSGCSGSGCESEINLDELRKRPCHGLAGFTNGAAQVNDSGNIRLLCLGGKNRSNKQSTTGSTLHGYITCNSFKVGKEACKMGTDSSCSFLFNDREIPCCWLPKPVCRKAFFQLRAWMMFSMAPMRILRKAKVDTSPESELTRASSYSRCTYRLYKENTCVSNGCSSEVIEAGTYITCIPFRVHACTTFLERCIFAASSININRHVFANGFSASPNTLITFTTTSLRSQALFRRRTKMLSVLGRMRRGVIHA